MKTWFHEIRKGYLGAIGAALLALTLATIPKLPMWVLGLSLSDTQVLYIRAGLALFGFAFLAGVGWVLYFQTRRKLHDAKRSPHHFQDDYVFDKTTGLFRHEESGVLCCGYCVLDERRSPVTEEESGWRCTFVYDHWYKNPDFVPF